jgi:hypothetical protein
MAAVSPNLLQREQHLRELIDIKMRRVAWVHTLSGAATLLDLDTIVARLRDMLGRFRARGVVDVAERPAHDLRFEEVACVDGEGSTLDVVARVGDDTVVLRVHHGRADAITYHLANDRSTYAEIYSENRPFSTGISGIAFCQIRRVHGDQAAFEIAESIRDTSPTTAGPPMVIPAFTSTHELDELTQLAEERARSYAVGGQ